MKKLLNNESGIALLMVSTAIVILSTIMINFTFDSKVNKIQAYNIEDRAKAKLTAEAGLKFAMVRLRLYKEAFNFLEKNQSAKDVAGPEVINSIWNFPFVYPIPITGQMNAIQKESLNDFMESAVLDGNMRLTIQNISNRINLNMLRISAIEQAKNQNQNGQNSQRGQDDENEAFSPEAQLYKTLEGAIQRKSENDEAFANRYYGMDIQQLVDVLVTYLSDPDETRRPGENFFVDEDLKPKSAPMASWSEMYALPLWTDELIELIQRDFTVHGAIMIDLNNITSQTLRLLLPQILDEDIEDFFEYKNNPDNPVFFSDLKQFKDYWVNTANVIAEKDFDEIFQKFEAQGIKFGPSPTIFEIVSEGIVNRATYKITAYVSIPAKPEKKVKDPTDIDGDGVKNQDDDDMDGDGIPNDEDDDIDGDGILNQDDNTPNGQSQQPGSNPPGNGQNNNNQNKQKTQLLEPRIIEIFIN